MLGERKNTMYSLTDKVLDIFYPMLRGVMTKQVYRFLAVGGVCFAVNILIFHSSYHWVYKPYQISTPYLPAYMFAFFTSLAITILLGFFLNYYFVFHGSVLERRVQFFRFSYSTLLEAIAGYYLMRFFVEKLLWFPTLALIVNVAIVQTVNYFIQRDYSFKK